MALEAKRHGIKALGVEGDKGAEWILVDLADVVVHVMMPEIRAFYALEKLWSVGSSERSVQDADTETIGMRIHLLAVGTRMPAWVNAGLGRNVLGSEPLALQCE